MTLYCIRCRLTTVTIQDRFFKQAKRQAAKENCTLGDIINDALRFRLVEASRSREGAEEGRPLKTYGRTGLRAGVDLSHNSALSDLMDEI
jgi:hypothetical protein